MIGRIVVYSIAGCPHCLAAKATLSQDGLEYTDVSLDRFKPFVREWVQENTGKTSVPQIYFNSQYIGGNKELQQQWQHQTKKQTLLAILQIKYDEDFPLIPSADDKVEIVVDDVNNDPALDVFAQSQLESFFKPVKKGLICGGMTGPSVKSSDFLDWITKKHGFDREKAVDIVDQLITRKLLSTPDVWNKENPDDFVLYTYKNGDKSGALNTEFPVQHQQVDAPDVAARIRKLILKLFAQFISEDGKFVDYQGMSLSPLWQHFKVMVADLQEADLKHLTRDQRLAFFINIYNVLVIHGTVVRGVPDSMYSRYRFFSTVSYMMGGCTYSLNDIENGMLRNNRRSMGTLYMKPFSSSDHRLDFSINPVDARIHFALNCGAKSCPPIKTFSADEVDVQLDLATRSFLENDEGVKIEEDCCTVYLSQLFNWYQVDFGNSKEDMLDWIAGHLNQEKAESLQRVRNTGNLTIKYIHYDWGNNEKKK